MRSCLKGGAARGLWLAALAVFAMLAGCAPVPSPTVRPAPVDTLGVLRGNVAMPADSASRPKRLSVLDVVVFLDRNDPRSSAPATSRRVRNMAQVAPRTHSRVVTARGSGFAPRVMAVASGDSVTFVNQDRVYHNVFSVMPNKEFNVGMIPPGGRRHHTFTQPGAVPIFCQLHTNTAGFVYVTPNRVNARPDDTGAWSLPPLPPGEYVVRAWHPELGERRFAARLNRDGTTVRIRF